MKILSKALLALYVSILLWLVLFKFSLNLPTVFDQSRDLNLIPFASYSQGNLKEMVYNFVVFIPPGLLLSVNLKRIALLQKLAIICIFSITLETIQLVFAIGITDITDVITNTFGGLIGLMLYDLGKKYVDSEKLDRYITVICAVLLALFVLSLGALLSNGVRFQSPPRGEMRNTLTSENEDSLVLPK